MGFTFSGVEFADRSINSKACIQKTRFNSNRRLSRLYPLQKFEAVGLDWCHFHRIVDSFIFSNEYKLGFATGGE